MRRPGPPPAADLGGFLMVGDSVSWRADDELAARTRGWTLDLRPGRRLDELPGRLDGLPRRPRQPQPADHPAGHQPPAGVQRGRLPHRDGQPARTRRRCCSCCPTASSTATTPARSRRPRSTASWMKRLAADRPLTCLADWPSYAASHLSNLVDGEHPGARHEGWYARYVVRAWGNCASSSASDLAPGRLAGPSLPAVGFDTLAGAAAQPPCVDRWLSPEERQRRRVDQALAGRSGACHRGCVVSVARRHLGFRHDCHTRARAAIAALQGHEAWAIIRRSTRAGTGTPSAWSAGSAGWSSRCSTYRSRPACPTTATSPTGCWRSRSGRCASAASRRTTTGRRWSSSTSRPSWSSRSRTSSRRSTTRGSSSPTAGGFDTGDEEYGKLVEAIIQDEIGQGEGANLVIGRHYRATVADWGADKALTRAQAAARARARRLLDLPLLHRRPLPDRRQPGAARHHPRRRRPDEPDQRHLPAPAAGDEPADLHDELLRLPARREGDLRALHGRRRGAQDDVRHLPRGRAGAGAVPQADEPAGAHRVPPGRAHRPRPARGAARHDVRRHGDRLAGRERLPADQAVRVGGARLLRRRAGRARPRRRGRAGRGQPDRDPHRRRRPRGPADRDRRRDAGARLRCRRTRWPRRTPRPAGS